VYVAAWEGPTSAAWTAGRRVGGSVRRNRARRLLREAWWRLAGETRPGYALVLVARREIVGANAHEVTEEVRKVLVDEGVLPG